VPKTVEFPSLVPLLHGGDTPVHDAVYCRYIDFQRSIRNKTHKLIVYPKINRVQLFDVAADPWEIHDLVDDASLSGVKKELFARLRKYQAQLGDPLVLTQS
jgi:arylsulfatase A-like enzyme